MSVFRRLVERREWSGPWGPPSDGTLPPPSWTGGRGGLPVSETTAMQVIDAYACVSLLVDGVGMLPVYEIEKRGKVRVPAENSSEVFQQPDPEIDREEWVSRFVMSLALRGNAYVMLDRSRSGAIGVGTLAHPDDVRPVRSRKTGLIEYEQAAGGTLARREVYHSRGITPPGQRNLVGLSPLDVARKGLALSMSAEDFGARWFDEGAAPSSVLETEQDMDDDQARKTQAKWIAAHGGHRRPAVLAGGLKWKPVTITPNESQFLETRKFQTAQTARVWRIPPHMIGDVERSTSWGSGIEEQGIGFTVFTLGPYIGRAERALTTFAAPHRQARINPAGLLRGNIRDRYLSYAIARQWGWMSVNDIRSLEDLQPVDGGDTYLQPLNMIDAEKALQVLLDQNSGRVDDV